MMPTENTAPRIPSLKQKRENSDKLKCALHENLREQYGAATGEAQAGSPEKALL